MMKADVVVCGGGLTGVAAAIQARRSGAGKVLLVERYGFLGGMATNGLVNPFMTYWKADRPHTQENQLVFGLFQEFLDRLQALGGLKDNRTTLDAEAMKLMLQRFALEEGVQLLLHSLVEAVQVKEGRLAAVRVANKAGTQYLAASAFVDCTGDADVAFLAGVPCRKGREQDGQCQPMTLCFRMAGVDRARMPSVQRITEIYLDAKAKGEMTNPREDVLYFDTMQEDVVHFNTTRVVLHDATDPWSLTDAELIAREQVWEMARFLKEQVPGFERSYLQMTATQTGARESRRIVGAYTLTAQDVTGQARFADCVCRFAYDIDIHNPTGTGTYHEYLPEGGYYEVPYRCMVPAYLGNLLVAGRPVSTTHEAHASLRVMPACVALGQAAGLAAAEKLRSGLSFQELDGRQLHRLLVVCGALREG